MNPDSLMMSYVLLDVNMMFRHHRMKRGCHLTPFFFALNAATYTSTCMQRYIHRTKVVHQVCILTDTYNNVPVGPKIFF